MGILSSLEPKNKGSQLHFYDDHSFEFRLLDIEDTFLVEKDKNKEIVKGWKQFYRNQFPFAGYKSIKAGQVSLSYERDIILDPYNMIENDENNPHKAGDKVVVDAVQGQKTLKGTRSWLSQVGEARRLKLLSHRAKSSNYDKLIVFLGCSLVLEILIIAIEALIKAGNA